MKKFIILFASFLFTVNSSFACSCIKPNFDLQDKWDIINDYLASNYHIAANNFSYKWPLVHRNYLTKTQKIQSFALSKLNLFDECDMYCMYMMNSDADYEIIYHKGGENCEVTLRLIMTSNQTNTGFSSKISEIKKPVCE